MILKGFQTRLDLDFIAQKEILEELKKIEVMITDKRKYGRAILIFLKTGKG